jgi:hypothetical protein
MTREDEVWKCILFEQAIGFRGCQPFIQLAHDKVLVYVRITCLVHSAGSHRWRTAHFKATIRH